jgi:hypothetical protein
MRSINKPVQLVWILNMSLLFIKVKLRTKLALHQYLPCIVSPVNSVLSQEVGTLAKLQKNSFYK